MINNHGGRRAQANHTLTRLKQRDRQVVKHKIGKLVIFIRNNLVLQSACIVRRFENKKECECEAYANQQKDCQEVAHLRDRVNDQLHQAGQTRVYLCAAQQPHERHDHRTYIKFGCTTAVISQSCT